MFDKDFIWGAASASFQIEGAPDSDGKTPSIWDIHCKKEGAVFNGDNAEVACDFYHRYKEDIALMKELGIKAYRMSLSWNRILPDDSGRVNAKGIEFYNGVIEELLKNGIEPYITLFHWDLPYYIFRKGGYLNGDFPVWFENYAKVVIEHFSDRATCFMTFNEPQVVMGGFRGTNRAPMLDMDDYETVRMAHNILLAHGKAVKIMRRYAKQPVKIGLANQGWFFYPKQNTSKNIKSAKKATFEFDNVSRWYSSQCWFSDPVYLGRYPEPLISELKKYLPQTWEQDLKEICQPLDFCGQNFYNATVVDENGKITNENAGEMYNSEGWNICPSGIYYAVKWLYERYKLPVLITENGICCHDWVSLDGKVHDPQRIDFVNRYLIELEKAYNEGVEIDGYFYWSFTDNMEWSEGYRPRFGLTYIDFATQERIKKDSFYWYKNLIKQ